MNQHLKIAPNLTLPSDAVTQTLIIYGGKGMGKTNLGAVLAEEFVATGHRFSIIDPMGVFWGLRHSADGKGPGVEVLILGGRHGDIPIEPTGGKVVADLVVDEDANVIIDISRKADGKMWSVGERIRFVADYCERLYERQGERSRPLMQIIDEAGRFCPQVIPFKSEDVARCVGAVSTMVEEGRNVALGVTLITQRSARMNKAVSELADCMIAFRTVGPLSIDAILSWFGEHVEKSKWKELIEKLRSLARGTALVVSPGWLNFEGVANMRHRQTFDSSATPKAGQSRVAQGKGAVVDLKRYQDRMAETIQRVKADDPKELKRKISELQFELEKALQKKGSPELDRAVMEKIAGAAEQVKRERESYFKWIREGRAQINMCLEEMSKFKGSMDTEVWRLEQQPGDITSGLNSFDRALLEPALNHSSVPQYFEPKRLSTSSPSGAMSPSAPRLKVLTALAQYPNGLSLKRLAILAGYTVNGHFTNTIGALRADELVTPARVTPIQITEKGKRHLGPFEKLPTGEALRRWWLDRLSEPEAKVLGVLFRSYPHALDINELARLTGYTVNGHFTNTIGTLRKKGLMTPARTPMKAAEELYT